MADILSTPTPVDNKEAKRVYIVGALVPTVNFVKAIFICEFVSLKNKK